MQFYLSSTTPSVKYEARAGKGDVVASYGISEKTGIEWKGCAKSINIKHFDDCNVQQPYKHMFQKLQDKADGKLLLLLSVCAVNENECTVLFSNSRLVYSESVNVN